MLPAATGPFHFVRATALLAAATGLVVAVLTWTATPSAPAPPPELTASSSGGWSATPSGPLGPADRALLVAVRQAGLWQMPVSQQAEQMATNAEVRAVAISLAAEHDELAGEVRTVAGRLGVVLPSQPTAEQRGWVAEISGATGPGYDRVLVNRVHTGCTATLAVLTDVLGGTGNGQIRAFAARASEMVGRHIRYLEGTGLVTTSPDAAALGDNLPVLALVALAGGLTVAGLARFARWRANGAADDPGPPAPSHRAGGAPPPVPAARSPR